MRARFAGFLLFVGGVLVGVGVYPTWITVGARSYNGFSMAASNLDAIVSLAVAGALVLFGFFLASRINLFSRLLAAIASIAAFLWAAVLALVLGPAAKVALTTLAPNVTPTIVTSATTYDVGFYLTAAGGVLSLLGGVLALTARRQVAAAEPAVGSGAGRQPGAPPPRSTHELTGRPTPPFLPRPSATQPSTSPSQQAQPSTSPPPPSQTR